MLSRVADSLYWMSRYLERAEHMARAIDVQLHLALDEAPSMASMGWVCLLGGLRADLPAELCSDDRGVTNALTFDRANPSSIVSCIASARENARQIREQITSDIWEELNQLYLSVKSMNIEWMWQSEPHAFLRSVQRGVQLLAGVADSSMNHGEGWQYIRLGRFLERAMSLAWLLDAHFGVRGIEMEAEPTAEDFVAWSGLLRTCSGFEPYCKVHTVELHPRRILDFLLFDAEFPHSVRFCAAQLESSIEAIAALTATPRDALVRRTAGRLHAGLGFGSLEEVFSSDLTAYLMNIVKQCFAINDAIYRRYISYPVDAALRGQFVESMVG
jgi:uncharacterized alpha-E superfamily protein